MAGAPRHRADTTKEIDMRVQGRGTGAGLKVLLMLVIAAAIVAIVYFQFLAPR